MTVIHDVILVESVFLFSLILIERIVVYNMFRKTHSESNNTFKLNICLQDSNFMTVPTQLKK